MLQLTILDMFKIWEALEGNGPLTAPMEKAKEHLENQLSTLICDLKLDIQLQQPQG